MKKVLITIIVLLLIAVLGIGGYFIWRLNEKMDEQSNQISTLLNEVKGKEENNNTVQNNTIENNTVNTTNTNTTNTVTNNTTEPTNNGTTTTTSNTEEEKIKEICMARLKQSYPNYQEYRIDNVKILTDAEKQEILQNTPGYSATDTFAVITYSIKPESIENYVVAGNGEISGDWVVNKSACVIFRDGQIIANGTGW